MPQRIYQWGTWASIAALTAGSTPQSGDVANITLQNQICPLIYDGVNLVWRAQYRFYATIADLSALAGLYGGDPVYLVDSGQSATWDSVHFVWVWSPLQIAPYTSTVAPSATVDFSASGGFGTYTYAITTNVSTASINSSTGVYTAGTGSAGTDIITVTDQANHSKTASVIVT
jgi:hypothetical protein